MQNTKIKCLWGEKFILFMLLIINNMNLIRYEIFSQKAPKSKIEIYIQF